MSVKFQSTADIILNLGLNNDGDIIHKATEICKDHMEKYVPKDKGPLRNTAYTEDNKIHYSEDYAFPQYRGYTSGPVVNYTTPGTGPYWNEKMVSAEMSDVYKEINDYMKGKK